jgi:hypothetical protein
MTEVRMSLEWILSKLVGSELTVVNVLWNVCKKKG